MSSRTYWLLAVVLALIGGFMIVESQAFAPVTAGVIAFAVAIAVTVIALGTVSASRGRGRGFAFPAAGIALIGAWTIVAMSGIFSPGTEKWLAFASGAGVLGLALAALTMHELKTERVVHALAVDRHEQEPAAVH